MSATAEAGKPEDDFADLPEALREVARTYGRSMFGLVMNAGMAGQAAEVLGALAQRSRSGEVAHAVSVLVGGFNQISNAYVVQMGWSPELLAQCERDVQRAVAGMLIVPGERTPRIVLEH